MASMRDIKRRRNSIASTQQITKAMKLVSTVKLQKTKMRAERSKPYFDKMYATVTSMLAKSGTIEHPYLKPQSSTKKAVILITSNRGLAGGYNSNVIKTVTGSDLKAEDIVLFTVGSKGREYFARRNYEIAKEYNEVIENPMFSDAKEICEEVLKRYVSGEVGEIYLAYTYFKNTVVHEPRLLKLLPIQVDEADIEAAKSNSLMNYEPQEEEALEIIIPKYMTSILYGALVEAVASENGARMQAMDSATSNADEMIEKLTLQYNRARQGSITQELTEIIAGANAIS
ncbi:MAG: ATP synthase F1 subunit gamma [Lachnospiraceae bacterium]|nr:ATP synthase F1 subunit gamma [Lachnospiraceae bacterium]MDD7077035.1 ATP synthase F1 subunit gamma [Lachnospiraceae bacterium]MDY3729874.1 ATP synthase F1 subunit gamma [Candidatus Choladocola sp.]